MLKQVVIRETNTQYHFHRYNCTTLFSPVAAPGTNVYVIDSMTFVSKEFQRCEFNFPTDSTAR